MNSPHGYSSIPPDSRICAMKKYTFTDDTAEFLTGEYPGTTVINRDTIADAWQELHHGAYVVMPAENSSSNRDVFVGKHYRYITDKQASIVASVQQRVIMCILGKKGHRDAEVSDVYSHDQALKQSRGRLSLYPQAQRHIMETTVDGAMIVSKIDRPGVIALGSRRSGEAHGLEVYEENITDSPFNATEMYVMHRNGEKPVPDPHARFHAVEFKPADEPGSLLGALDVMADHGIDLVSLHTHYPQRDGRPSILAELEKFSNPRDFRKMIDAFGKTRNEYRFLGSWNERLLTDPMDIPPPYTNRVVDASGLDPDSRLHRLDIILKNRPGILRDILREVARNRGNLYDIGSYAIAPRQYGFDVYMESFDVESQIRMHEALAANDDVGVMRWHSGNDREKLRPGAAA